LGQWWVGGAAKPGDDSDPASRTSAAATIASPRCHVVRTTKVASAMASGSHPPSTTLVRLAAKNATSTVSRTPPVATVRRAVQPKA
jgi:hypothetical protein